MRVLLDTHALLWAVLDPDSLSQRSSQLIGDVSTVVLVSAASAWEIATKVRLGKLHGAEAFEAEFLELIDEAGYTLVGIDAGDALRVGRLDGNHRGPLRPDAGRASPDARPPGTQQGCKTRRIWRSSHLVKSRSPCFGGCALSSCGDDEEQRLCKACGFTCQDALASPTVLRSLEVVLPGSFQLSPPK